MAQIIRDKKKKNWQERHPETQRDEYVEEEAERLGEKREKRMKWEGGWKRNEKAAWSMEMQTDSVDCSIALMISSFCLISTQ